MIEYCDFGKVVDQRSAVALSKKRNLQYSNAYLESSVEYSYLTSDCGVARRSASFFDSGSNFVIDFSIIYKGGCTIRMKVFFCIWKINMMT